MRSPKRKTIRSGDKARGRGSGCRAGGNRSRCKRINAGKEIATIEKGAGVRDELKLGKALSAEDKKELRDRNDVRGGRKAGP